MKFMQLRAFCIQEAEAADFESRKRDREEVADAKTAKNRAKRQKRKAARKGGKGKAGSGSDSDSNDDNDNGSEVKKKRVLGGDGKAVVFRKPGEDSDGEEGDVGPVPEPSALRFKADASKTAVEEPESAPVAVVDVAAIVIHDDD